MDFIEAMKALLYIYNFKLDRKEADKWEWGEIKEHLEVFANSIFPTPKRFDPAYDKIIFDCFRDYTIEEKESSISPPLLTVDIWDWKDITRRLDVFVDSIFPPLHERFDPVFIKKRPYQLCSYDVEEKKLSIGPLLMTVDVKEIKDLYLLMDCLKQEVRLDLIHFSISQLRSETFVNRNDQNFECYSGKSDTQVFYEIFDEGIRPIIENVNEKTEELIKQFFAQAKKYEGDLERIKSILRILFQHHNIPKEKSDYIVHRFLEIIEYLKNRKNEISI